LTGHGLSDLLEAASIQVRLEEWDSEYSNWNDEKQFMIGWRFAFLRAPTLVAEDVRYEWSDLQLSYYCNGELVKVYSLKDSEALQGADLTRRTLGFQVPTYSYKMPRFWEEDRHEIKLEGRLTINGSGSDFSLPLASWVIENQTMVRQ
jgi:hypothetical protein